MTGRGFATAVLAAVLLAGGWALSLPELFACGIGLVAVLVVALLWVWLPRRRPRLSIAAEPNPAFARTSIDVTATMSGRSVRPVLLSGPISDGRSIRLWARPGMRGAQVGTFAIPVAGRGLLHIGPFRLESIDPLGLAHRKVGSGGALTVKVRPAVTEVPALPAGAVVHRDRDAVQVATARVSATGTEQAGLRTYVPGDELRLVHWKASAKGRGMLVRTFDPEASSSPVLVLDDRAEAHSPESFELALELCASLLVANPRPGIEPGLGPRLVLWSDAVSGTLAGTLAGTLGGTATGTSGGVLADAALDRLVSHSAQMGLVGQVDGAVAGDLLISGPYSAQVGALPVPWSTAVVVIDPRGEPSRAITSAADLSSWQDIAS